MANPYVAGTFTQDTGTSVTSVTIPITTAVPSGGFMVLYVQAMGGTAGKTFSATDSSGNTWTSRFVNEDAPTNNRLAMLTAPVTTGLTTAHHVTLTISQARATWLVAVIAVPSATAYNVTANASGAATTAVNTGTTATGAQASQIEICGAGWTGAGTGVTFTPAAGTAFTSLVVTTASRGLRVWWRTTATVATRNETGTLSTSNASAAGIAVFNVPASVVWQLPDGSGGWVDAEAMLPDGSGGWV